MALSLVAVTNAAGSSGSDTSFTTNVPAGDTAGDVLIWTLASQNATVVPTPSGWTVLRQATTTLHQQSTFYRVCVGGEPTSYTATGLTSARYAGTMQLWKGVNATALDVTVPASNAGTTSVTVPAITPTTAGAVIVAIASHTVAWVSGAAQDATWTSSNLDALTSDAQSQTTATGNNAYIGSGYKAWTSGSFTANLTNTETKVRSLGTSFALRPAPSLAITASGAGTTGGSVDITIPVQPLAVTASGTGTSGGAAAMTLGIPQVVNYLAQFPSFEWNPVPPAGTTGVFNSTALSGTNSYPTTDPVDGLFFQRVTNVANSLASGSVSNVPHQQYGIFSIYLRASSATGVFCSIAGPSGGTNSTTFNVTTSWARYSVGVYMTGTAGSTGTASVTFVPDGDTTTFDLDAAMFTALGTTLYPYFDGNTTDTSDFNYNWVGTTYSSRSTRNPVYAYTASGTGATSGSAAITIGTGTDYAVTGSGTGTSGGSGAFTLTNSLSASGSGVSSGSAAIGGVSPVTASGTGVFIGTADITRDAREYAVTAAGTGASAGSAAITVDARTYDLSAAGTGTSSGSANLTLIEVVSAAGTGTTSGTADIVRDARDYPVVSAGTGTFGGAATIGIVGAPQDLALSSAGTGATSGSAAITVDVRTYALTASGTGTSAGSAAITVDVRTYDLTAAGTGVFGGSARFLITLSASGTGTTGGSVAARLTMSVTAWGTYAVHGDAAFTSTIAITAAGTGTTGGSAALTLIAGGLAGHGTGTFSGSAVIVRVSPTTYFYSASGLGVTTGAARIALLLALRATGSGVTTGGGAIFIPRNITICGGALLPPITGSLRPVDEGSLRRNQCVT